MVLAIATSEPVILVTRVSNFITSQQKHTMVFFSTNLNLHSALLDMNGAHLNHTDSGQCQIQTLLPYIDMNETFRPG